MSIVSLTLSNYIMIEMYQCCKRRTISILLGAKKTTNIDMGE